MRGRRTLLASLGALLATLAASSTANAGGLVREARFTARISGTYTTQGTVTNTRCERAAPDDTVTFFTATGNASERTSFRATRGALLGVSLTRGERYIAAGGPPIPVSATMDRASTLESSSEPLGCKPGPRSTMSCGRRTRAYRLAVFSPVRRGFVLSYNFSSGFSTTFPDDPFECPPVAGQSWWGGYFSRGNGRGAVSPALLFNRRVRRIVVRGALRLSPRRSSAAEGWSASSSATLTWTLTLIRRG